MASTIFCCSSVMRPWTLQEQVHLTVSWPTSASLPAFLGDFTSRQLLMTVKSSALLQESRHVAELAVVPVPVAADVVTGPHLTACGTGKGTRRLAKTSSQTLLCMCVCNFIGDMSLHLTVVT